MNKLARPFRNRGDEKAAALLDADRCAQREGSLLRRSLVLQHVGAKHAQPIKPRLQFTIGVGRKHIIHRAQQRRTEVGRGDARTIPCEHDLHILQNLLLSTSGFQMGDARQQIDNHPI